MFSPLSPQKVAVVFLPPPAASAALVRHGAYGLPPVSHRRGSNGRIAQSIRGKRVSATDPYLCKAPPRPVAAAAGVWTRISSRINPNVSSLSPDATQSIRSLRERIPWAISPSQLAPPISVVIEGSISLARLSTAMLDEICSKEQVLPTTFGDMSWRIWPMRSSPGRGHTGGLSQ